MLNSLAFKISAEQLTFAGTIVPKDPLCGGVGCAEWTQGSWGVNLNLSASAGCAHNVVSGQPVYVDVERRAA